MQALSIDPATANDCYECAHLLVEHLKELGIDADPKLLARLLEDTAGDSARGFLLVARENGRVVGVAYVATILSVEHCGLVAWLEEHVRHAAFSTARASGLR